MTIVGYTVGGAPRGECMTTTKPTTKPPPTPAPKPAPARKRRRRSSKIVVEPVELWSWERLMSS